MMLSDVESSACPLACAPACQFRDVLRGLLERSALDLEMDDLHLGDHSYCILLTALFRGKLCEDLAGGPGRRIEPGELLYRMGDPASSVYLVRSGLIKTSMLSPGGQELTLRLHKPGDVLGELCLCAGERREQAAALEVSEVVPIPLETLIARLRRDPQAALDLASAACENLMVAYERLRSFSTDLTVGRLVRALLDLATEIGEATPDGVRITRHITQNELANLIGARREVVSGHLNRLRDRGLISYNRQDPIVIDRGALQEFLATLDDS